MSLWICTLAELKADLGLNDTTDDAVLTRWMEGLQGRFESYLQRLLPRTVDQVEIFDGEEQTEILLARFPVESIASVHVSDEQEWSDDTLMDAGDYRVRGGRGVLLRTRRDIGWPAGVQNIRVVYTGGFVAAGTAPDAGQTAMPEAIRGAFAMQCAFEFRNRLELGKASASMQGQSMQLAEAKFLPAVTDAIDPFRRIV